MPETDYHQMCSWLLVTGLHLFGHVPIYLRDLRAVMSQKYTEYVSGLLACLQDTQGRYQPPTLYA